MDAFPASIQWSVQREDRLNDIRYVVNLKFEQGFTITQLNDALGAIRGCLEAHATWPNGAPK